jgi:hypothetical protein
MTVPTQQQAGIRHRVRRPLGIIVSLAAVALVAAFVAFSAAPATAHPSYGQPCRCHNPAGVAKVTFTAPTTAKRSVLVRVTGAVSNGRAGLKAKVQVKKGTVWTTYKTVILSSTRKISTTWKAAAKAGKYQLRLYYLGDNVNKPRASAVRTVTVK